MECSIDLKAGCEFNFGKIFLKFLIKNGHTVAVVRASPKLRLLSKIVFRQSSSSVRGCLLSKFVFRQRSSSIKGRLPSKVVFRKRSSSAKGCSSSKVVLHQIICRDSPYVEHFRYRDSTYVVHSKRRDCTYI